MSEILLHTKLYIPPLRPNLVVRPRLTDQFAEGLRLGRKLTLISAPAGFGKTTLITACLQQAAADYRACWVSLDSSDNDLNRFLTYLIAAIQTIDPDFAHGLLSTLTTLPSPEPDSLTRALLNELTALPQAIIVVLDDYHVITNTAIHTSLEMLVDYLPPTVHLVLTSREEPPLALPRWRVRNQLTDIRADDLRFQMQEARDFLQQTMGLELTETAVSTLESRTEGWIAGLQLAAMSLRSHTNPDAHIDSFTGSDRLVTDYLISEVLSHQPPDMQHFLLHTAILERFNAALCDHLLNQTGSQNMLDMLEQSNLFLIPLDNQRNWYRYHHLFAELLRHRLGRDAAETAVFHLHLRAADWFLAQGERSAAIQHTLQAQDFDRAAQLVAETPTHMLWEQSGGGLLRQWGHALPAAALRQHPRAAFLIASAHMIVGEIKMVQEYLQMIDKLVQGGTETAVSIRAELSLLKAILARNDDNHQQALGLLEQAQPHLPSTDLTLQTIADMQLAVNYYELGHLTQSQNAIRHAQQRLTTDNEANLSLWLQARQMQGRLAMIRADLTEAEQIYKEGMRVANQFGQTNPMIGLMYNGLGDIYFEWNEIEQAAQFYRRSVELGNRTGITDILIEANLGEAAIAVYQGDTDKTEAILDDLLGLIRPSKLAGIMEAGEAITASFYLQMGRVETAVRWANASGYRLTDKLSYRQNNYYRLLVEIRLAECRATGETGTLPQILTLITYLHTLLQSARHRHGVIETRILKALTLAEMGDQPAALASLQSALDAAQPGSYTRTFVRFGQPMHTLLKQVEHADPNYVRHLLTAFLQESKSPAEFANMPPFALTKRELDVLMQLAAGLTNKEIEAALFISQNTVRTHIKNLYSKLHAENRTQAINQARKLGILGQGA